MEENKSQNETTPAKPEAHSRAVKKIKIRALRPILVDRVHDKVMGLNGRIVEVGSVVEVSEEEAKELCDTHFRGHFGFGGERWQDDGKFPMHDYRRAERV